MANKAKKYNTRNKYKMLKQNKARAEESRASVRESERRKAEAAG